jgi:hypothetical protein
LQPRQDIGAWPTFKSRDNDCIRDSAKFRAQSALTRYLNLPFRRSSKNLFVVASVIAHYGEAFDRGVALVQLEFSAERIKHILARAATALNRNPETKRHLDRISAG